MEKFIDILAALVAVIVLLCVLVSLVLTSPIWVPVAVSEYLHDRKEQKNE